MSTPNSTQRKTNSLAGEKSPYLLQHQYNPVDWHAWGEAAFGRARAENKPIFLSIGYSTCHWCHVMERESFEDEAVAGFLNEHFISIKVDREERPDVDKIYMAFVQATTGQGGWPLNVFLGPDLKPFFGGTYFPPDNRHGRPGFLHLLRQIRQLWASKREDVLKSAADMHRRLEDAIHSAAKEVENTSLSPEWLRQAGENLKQHFDARHGGFGSAPKFPQPSQPQMLLHYAKRFGDVEAVRMVLHTCDQMAAGGIHDQLGGGFSRYSVDAQWLVPHFEKMLYDNAQLVHLYLDAWLVSGEEPFAAVARDILDYVLRDMTDPSGGFYSAEDADSEGHEGKFYCWTLAELSQLLSPQEYEVAVRYFGLSERGNFVDHSHPTPLPNQNVLSVVDRHLPAELERVLEAAKMKMRTARASRVRPGLDDKVLASWNGLMLGAFARAYAVLGVQKYLTAAEKNLSFLEKELWDNSTRTLYHRWRAGERDSVQLLEAYAFLLDGVLRLYEASLKSEHLTFAVVLAEAIVERFFDADQGGFYQTTADAPNLILRTKQDYDGAEPSGNSVATLCLLKLGVITGRTDFTAAAEKTLKAFSGRLAKLPQAIPYLMQALDFALQPPVRVVINGVSEQPRTVQLIHAAHSVYQPNKVVLGVEGPVEPFAKTLAAQKQAAFICSGLSCKPPADDPEAVKEALAAS